jgi:hypothetical protein
VPPWSWPWVMALLTGSDVQLAHFNEVIRYGPIRQHGLDIQAGGAGCLQGSIAAYQSLSWWCRPCSILPADEAGPHCGAVLFLVKLLRRHSISAEPAQVLPPRVFAAIGAMIKCHLVKGAPGASARSRDVGSRQVTRRIAMIAKIFILT